MEEEALPEKINPEADKDEPAVVHPNVVQGPKPNWLKIGLLVLAGLVLLGGAGYAGYWYANESVKRKAQSVKPQLKTQNLTPTPSVEEQTKDWKTYRNENLGFELKYPEPYLIVEEKADSVSFGFRETPDQEIFSYLVISTNLTNYTSYKPCKVDDLEFPCLSEGKGWGQEENIADTKLGGVNAKSFYVTQAIPDVHYHIVQTTESPLIEAKMFVAGGGLDKTFDQILSTLQFTD